MIEKLVLGVLIVIKNLIAVMTDGTETLLFVNEAGFMQVGWNKCLNDGVWGRLRRALKKNVEPLDASIALMNNLLNWCPHCGHKLEGQAHETDQIVYLTLVTSLSPRMSHFHAMSVNASRYVKKPSCMFGNTVDAGKPQRQKGITVQQPNRFL